jgi:hypothetical protein
MRRVHLAPYVALTIIGLLLLFFMSGLISAIIGFIATIAGVGGSVYHLTVDEHITL